MHRPPKNRTVRSALVNLPQGEELNLVIIIKVKIGIGKKEVVVIIIKEFIVRIHALKPNLFKLVVLVSRHRVYR